MTPWDENGLHNYIHLIPDLEISTEALSTLCNINCSKILKKTCILRITTHMVLKEPYHSNCISLTRIHWLQKVFYTYNVDWKMA